MCSQTKCKHRIEQKMYLIFTLQHCNVVIVLDRWENVPLFVESASLYINSNMLFTAMGMNTFYILICRTREDISIVFASMCSTASKNFPIVVTQCLGHTEQEWRP